MRVSEPPLPLHSDWVVLCLQHVTRNGSQTQTTLHLPSADEILRRSQSCGACISWWTGTEFQRRLKSNKITFDSATERF